MFMMGRAMKTTLRDLANKQHGQSRATMDVAEYDRQVRARRSDVTIPCVVTLGQLVAAALKVGLTVMCPTCQSPLCVDRRATKYTPGRRGGRPVRIAFCTGCERAEEF